MLPGDFRHHYDSIADIFFLADLLVDHVVLLALMEGLLLILWIFAGKKER